MRRQIDSSVLEMALVGYQAEHQKIVEKIAEIQRQLGGRVSKPVLTANGSARRQLSAAARHRIAAAQRKRWKEFHAKQAAGNKPAAKRTLSPEVKAKRIAALAKARAAKAARAAANA
jgi:hypothetical protein